MQPEVRPKGLHTLISVSRKVQNLVSIGLVYSIHVDNSTEAVIQRMIEAAQRMIRVNNSEGEEEPEIITINPAIKRHFEL